jgi:selenocysteine-specific elongation factor
MTETHFILATAGHVDHGKSALVNALTGTDPDRLPEEKMRGITIDLGFAELNLNGPNGEIFHVGIVDVPGHEDFVRNMIAGVGSIDLALLVVAADDGWMPQTEEHFEILEYLGIKRLIVALTKSDLGKIDIVCAQILEQLNQTPFADSKIIPTSIRTADGIEQLKSALASELASLSAPRDFGKARLFVDRVFSLHGIGTVVTGTLTGGQLRRGETVSIQPRKNSARVRSIQSHNRDLETAHPGMRTAINLPDIAIGPDGIQRGDVITTLPLQPASTIDVFLTRSSRLKHVAIKSGTSAYVHHGTTRVLAKIILAETNSLAPGQSAVAQLRLQAPLLAFVGDRLILRDASEQQTIAGGLVLDLDSVEVRANQKRALLASRAVAPDDVDLAVWTELACNEILDTSRLLERSCFRTTQIEAVLQKLQTHGDIFLHEQVAVKTQIWRELFARAAKLIEAAHKAQPERRGMELNDLRPEFESISPAAFDALIVDLSANGFVRTGSTIAQISHRAALPPQLQLVADEIRAELGKKPFDPPNQKELAQDRHRQQALKFLIEQGEIIQINDELLLLRDSVEQMRTAVADFISSNGAASASQLRERIGTSRRVIIPFLEYLDRAGATVRTGDLRKLRDPKPATVARS